MREVVFRRETGQAYQEELPMLLVALPDAIACLREAACGTDTRKKYELQTG